MANQITNISTMVSESLSTDTDTEGNSTSFVPLSDYTAELRSNLVSAIESLLTKTEEFNELYDSDFAIKLNDAGRLKEKIIRKIELGYLDEH